MYHPLLFTLYHKSFYLYEIFPAEKRFLYSQASGLTSDVLIPDYARRIMLHYPNPFIAPENGEICFDISDGETWGSDWHSVTINGNAMGIGPRSFSLSISKGSRITAPTI